MTKFLPIVVFAILMITSQVAAFLGAVLVDRMGGHWWSIIAYGVFSFVFVVVAWRLTVVVVDRILVPAGIVDGTLPGAKA